MRSDWVMVDSEDELRPGMLLKVAPCRYCMRVHLVLLIRRHAPLSFVGTLDGGREPNTAKWSWDIGLKCAEDMAFRKPLGMTERRPFDKTIRERRLWRLRDLPAEETTTVATRRVVAERIGR